MKASDIPEETLRRFERWRFVGSDHFEIAALARAELDRRTTPKVSEPEVRIKTHNEVAEYISRLGWSEYATSREKTLVAGNIWTFWVLMCGGKPEDTKQEELSVFSNPPIEDWRDVPDEAAKAKTGKVDCVSVDGECPKCGDWKSRCACDNKKPTPPAPVVKIEPLTLADVPIGAVVAGMEGFSGEWLVLHKSKDYSDIAGVHASNKNKIERWYWPQDAVNKLNEGGGK